MYKSKYSNLIQHLMNEHDLILLDSEQQEIEKWVDKDLKAIDVIQCCKSDSEQLCKCTTRILENGNIQLRLCKKCAEEEGLA